MNIAVHDLMAAAAAASAQGHVAGTTNWAASMLRELGSQDSAPSSEPAEDFSAVPGPHWGKDGEPIGSNPLLDQSARRTDANDLERMAKERPDECFLKGSGILKLTGGIRLLEGQMRVAVALLGECIGPLEASAAILEDEDGGEAIETLITQLRSFVGASHYVDTATPQGAISDLEAAKPVASPLADDFVEHSHPEFGGGYFCTPDVYARIAPLSAEGMEEQVRLWETKAMELAEQYGKDCDYKERHGGGDAHGMEAWHKSKHQLRTHLQSHPGRAK